MTTLYFVRHTESVSNDDGNICGITDSAVSKNGYIQLERLANRFAEVKLDRIIASPLTRTRETAAAVNRGRGLEIELDSRLIEINIGIWEDANWVAIKKKGGEVLERWQLYPDLFEIEGGDKMSDYYARAAATVDEIAASNDGKAVAIVTHGCFLRNMLAHVKQNDITALRTQKRLYNTSVTKILYDCDKNEYAVEYENDVSHLEGVKII